MIKFKRILVAVLTAVFLVGSGVVPDITTSTTMAAEATNLDELGGVFPGETQGFRSPVLHPVG